MSKVKEEVIVREEASGGMKGDGGKNRWDLVYHPFLTEMVKVLTFGADKYDDYNWQKLSRERIEAAVNRHFNDQYLQGEKSDDETGLSHLAHMACSLMFLHWFDQQARIHTDECTDNQTKRSTRSPDIFNTRFCGDGSESNRESLDSTQPDYGDTDGIQYCATEGHGSPDQTSFRFSE